MGGHMETSEFDMMFIVDCMTVADRAGQSSAEGTRTENMQSQTRADKGRERTKLCQVASLSSMPSRLEMAISKLTKTI